MTIFNIGANSNGFTLSKVLARFTRSKSRMRDTSNRRKALSKKTKLSIPFFQEEVANAYGTN